MSGTRTFRIAGLALLASLSLAAQAVADAPKQVDIPAGDLSGALIQLSKQHGVDLFYRPEQVHGLKTNGAHGTLTTEQAISRLIEGTSLKLSTDSTGAMVIALPRSANTAQLRETQTLTDRGFTRVAKAQPEQTVQTETAARPAAQEASEAQESGIPEVLVKGSKVLNMDVKRSRDDAQPYVIFERETIVQSGATNLEDFLRRRLTMHTGALASGQAASTMGDNSRFNLRGLGSNQTLILVDGHRMVSVASTATTLDQSDVNGIPIGAIERIEVLPTTASGIYGGGATGGVINIVMRRDYSGSEVKVTYDSTFKGNSTLRRVDASGGFNFGERTNVLLVGSYSDASTLFFRDRNLIQRGRAELMARNPGFLLNAADPPLGATTNIRSVNGSPLFGPGSSYFTSVPVGYAGGGGLAPLLARAGQYNLDLADNADGGGRAFTSAPTIEAVSMTLRHQFTPKVQAFLETGYNRKTGAFPANSFLTASYTLPASATNNPFGQAIRVTVPFAGVNDTMDSDLRDIRMVGGVIVALPRGWRVAADYTLDRSRLLSESMGSPTTAAMNSIVSGAIDVIRDTNRFPIDIGSMLNPDRYSGPIHTELKDANIRLSGQIGSLPAGRISVSSNIERRREIFNQWLTLSSAGVVTMIPTTSMRADSLYVETKIPLFSARNKRPGLEELELQVAGRYDEYMLNGAQINVTPGATDIQRAKNVVDSVNPTVGLIYRPLPDLMLRASYGTGFLPPGLGQMVPTFRANLVTNATDPRRGGTNTGPLGGIVFGNPELIPEDSESFSLGAILTPSFLPGARLSVDYTRIDKTNNITSLTVQQVIDNEGILPGRVTREAPAAGDPYGVGRITEVNISQLNIAQAHVEAYDVALDYSLDAGRWGRVDIFSGATWQTRYETRIIPSAAVTNNVGATSSGPLRLRANAGATLQSGSWKFGWNARYFDSYNTTMGIGVPSQDYHDVFAVWTAPPTLGSQWLRDTELQLGIKNVFDKEPPFDPTSSVGFYSVYGDARMATYYLTAKRSF